MVRELPLLIKHVGRGPRLAKDLPRDEAAHIMSALLAGRADPIQVGGFLMAMRMKSEAPAELAGFVDAMRESCAPIPLSDDPRPLVDVDLHGDGREGRPQLALVAAVLAASFGARFVLRGDFTSRYSRNDLAEVFTTLNIHPRLANASAALSAPDAGLALVDLAELSPPAANLLALRARLGVRTCINSTIKLLDPTRCARAAIGIFHSPYHAPMAQAATLLAVRRAAIVQAPGGVPELAPDRPTRTTLVDSPTQPPAEPTPLGGADAPLATPPPAPLPTCETPAALAELLHLVAERPAHAPESATRSTLLTANLYLWLANLAPAPDHPETLAALRDRLFAGAAASVLRALRACYTP